MKSHNSYFKLFNKSGRKYSLIILSAIFLLFSIDTLPQDVISKNGMVASAHPLASKAGLQILKDGGNAVDAMVATAFALGVVEPNASGIGGGGFMMIKLAAENKGITIDFRETAPDKAVPGMYYENDVPYKDLVHAGGMSIGVPGTMAGLALALEKYGTMSLSEVLNPAIKYAESGFEVSEKFSNMIVEAYDVILANEATSQIYLDEGLPLMEGGVISNPNLANTYLKIAERGADTFYKGEIAEAIVSEMKEQNGLITREDLETYSAEIKNPVTGTYRGYQIISAAPPTGGGTHLVELLNILESFNLKYLQHNSVEYIHVLAEAMKIVYADKSKNMADPAFYFVPVDSLTNKIYAHKVRKNIDLNKCRDDYRSSELLYRESNSTTHLSVVDKEGNLTALTQSINHWFGSGVTVKGTGILLNNHLGDFSSKPGTPNSIEPNKKPVSSIAPTLVLKAGKPFLSIGTPGGSRIIGALAQIIINIIDFDMGIDDAIEAPRVHVTKNVLHVEGRIDSVVVSGLIEIGHKVKIHPDYDNYFGGAQGILIDHKLGEIRGGADSRRDGVAIGY
ncbi:MAG: gamma-glutamyltransferase [Bacteroidota bacterium]